ncbi:MAG TPA: hypothetical protein VOA87_08770 [Thermoanaerobaculia bacterium]|nr:hypothetical protein [Thermoanaerobaculia bacterium]
MPTPSFKEKLADLAVLNANLIPHLPDLPQVAADQTALAALLAEAKTLQEQQEIQKGLLRETNQRRTEIDQSGRDLRNRIGATLKGSFGLESEKLLQFGIKPRARVVRVKRPSKADKAEALASASAKATAEAAVEAASKAAAKAAAKMLAEAAGQ